MSETAAVDLANIALISIGEDPITDLAEVDRASARIANERYPNIRDALLRTYKWNFATTIASLPGAALTTPGFGFVYSTPLPAGAADSPTPYCLRVWKVDTKTAWAVRGRAIFSAAAPPLLVEYVHRAEDVSTYDPLFNELLGAQMGLLLLNRLSTQETRRRVQRLRDLYQERRSDARRADAMEQSPDNFGDGGSWINSRRTL